MTGKRAWRWIVPLPVPGGQTGVLPEGRKSYLLKGPCVVIHLMP